MVKSIAIRTTFITAATALSLAASSVYADTRGGLDKLSDDKSDEQDILACYGADDVDFERLVINVRFHSKLSTDHHRGSEQVAYSVHGKDVGVCGPKTMAASTGSVVVAGNEWSSSSKNSGARMGITTHSVGGVGNIQTCASVEYNCTSEEDSPVPRRWICNISNEFGRFFPNVILERKDPEQDRICRRFIKHDVFPAPIPTPIPTPVSDGGSEDARTGWGSSRPSN